MQLDSFADFLPHIFPSDSNLQNYGDISLPSLALSMRSLAPGGTFYWRLSAKFVRKNWAWPYLVRQGLFSICLCFFLKTRFFAHAGNICTPSKCSSTNLWLQVTLMDIGVADSVSYCEQCWTLAEKERMGRLVLWERWEILADDASYSLPLWMISGAKRGENRKDKRRDDKWWGEVNKTFRINQSWLI